MPWNAVWYLGVVKSSSPSALDPTQAGYIKRAEVGQVYMAIEPHNPS